MIKNDYDSGKATAVKFFMVLTLIASVVDVIVMFVIYLVGGIFSLVPLAWEIPMTIYAFRRLNRHERIGNGFKVCTLLFHNMLAGIILFCMKTEGEEEEDISEPVSDIRPRPSRSGQASPQQLAPVGTESQYYISRVTGTAKFTSAIVNSNQYPASSMAVEDILAGLQSMYREHDMVYVKTIPGKGFALSRNVFADDQNEGLYISIATDKRYVLTNENENWELLPINDVIDTLAKNMHMEYFAGVIVNGGTTREGTILRKNAFNRLFSMLGI